MEQSKKYSQFFLFTVVLGWALSFYSLWHRQSLINGSAEGSSFCNINSAINCDAVALSEFSSFLSLPVSTWALAFYALLFIVGVWGYFSIIDKKEGSAKAAIRCAWWISLFGLLPTLALALVSFFVLDTACLLCIGTYVLNIAIFILAHFNLKKSAAKGAPLKNHVPSWALWSAVILCAFNLSSIYMVDSWTRTGPTLDSKIQALIIQQHKREKIHEIDVGSAPIDGPSEAPVTIVEFSDFQCPHCKRAATILPNVLASFPGKVRMVYMHYPLDSSCNPHMQGSPHPYACAAAKTSICVYQKAGINAYVDFKNLLFKNQHKINREFIKETAKATLGSQVDQLDTCLESSETHEKVVQNIEKGQAVGIKGTPAIYINGRYVSSSSNPEILREIIGSYL